MFLIIGELCWVWVHLVKRVRKLFLMILVNFVVLINCLFFLFKGMYVTKAFLDCSSNFSSTCKVDLDLWHCKLGHNNKRDVQKLSKSVQGRKMHNSSISESFFDICAANELNRKPPSSKMALRMSSKLELVYSDVRGPMETTSFGGPRYIVSFIDSYSRCARAYFMKHKSEVLEKFRHFCMDEGVHKTLSRWNRLLKMMIHALKKLHLCQSPRLQIQILTFMRNSKHVAFAMLKLLSVMAVLLINLRTFHWLNVSRVKRSLTLRRKLKSHNRETNG